ncbi:MAG: bifunctional glutamate N-acetyltransferase/amino-acid acetyltransferase ArgJ [Nitrospira sp.]|nr:bifunctional glutamate N-acetyltransferase/amino-acid acetyltransferase ArgJ [Nitrospira sp.]
MGASSTRILRGGITSVQGFMASGIHAGIKKDGRPDLALILSQSVATVAGCLTRNRFKAAPLLVTREHLKTHRGRAIIVNSGNANACTGKQGYRDAKKLTQWVAEALHLPMHQVFVASTGVISEPLPMKKIQKAIPKVIDSLSSTGGHRAAKAMMTTDTFPKEFALTSQIDKTPVTLGGMAKGSGMIHPDLATMLAFIGTDVAIESSALQEALRIAVDQSFNRISVDGDTSTNDLVLCLANGLAENPLIRSGTTALKVFTQHLTFLCQELAKMIVRDGEGATKFVTLQVRRARNESEALRIAEAIARSILVKTALFGEDANWGRIMAAIGASGVDVPAERISLSVNGIQIAQGGIAVGKRAEAQANRKLRQRNITLTVGLGQGKAEVIYYTTDLSQGYVKINAAYRT